MTAANLLLIARRTLVFLERLLEKAHDAAQDDMEIVHNKQLELQNEITQLETEYDKHGNLAEEAHNLKNKLKGILDG